MAQWRPGGRGPYADGATVVRVGRDSESVRVQAESASNKKNLNRAPRQPFRPAAAWAALPLGPMTTDVTVGKDIMICCTLGILLRLCFTVTQYSTRRDCSSPTWPGRRPRRPVRTQRGVTAPGPGPGG